MKKKVFIFIGPQKTGTTTIFELLKFDVGKGEKEQYTLTKSGSTKKEIMRIENQNQNPAYIVEPSYYSSQTALINCEILSKKYDLHIVHSNRDPLERAKSHYLHHFLRGRINNIDDALINYPEIFESSKYRKYNPLWKTSVKNFHTVDINGSIPLRTQLEQLGVKCIGEASRLNERINPRSRLVAKFFSNLSRLVRILNLEKFVPSYIRVSLRGLVMTGGENIELSNEEIARIKKCILDI